MKKTLLLSAALIAAAVSCTKENFAPVEGTTTLEVSLDNTNRTGLAEAVSGSRKIYWLEGDCLAWDGVASAALGSDYTADAALSSATFTWSGVLSKPCDILYPASFYKSATEITLPAVQNAFAGADGIATNVLPMYCRIPAGESAPALKSITGLVKISWTLPDTDADGHEMKVIEFSGNNNEQVSGVFTIDYSTGALSATSTDDADKKVTVVAGKTATDSTTCTCLLSVPAGEYSNGFTVTLVDKYGHYMEKSKSSAFTVTAGKVAVLPAFEFIPSATRMTVIASADDWNEYAAAYNSGEFTDATITANLDFSSADSLNTITKSYQNTLKGNNSEFQNVTTDKALFSSVGAEGVVENITLTSSYAINALECGTKGGVVTVLDGALRGVVFNGTFDFTYEDDAETHFVGGIVARMTGSAIMEDCEFNGTLRNTQTSVNVAYQYVGGVLASAFDDPTLTKTFKDCKFGGQIILGNGSTSAGVTQTGTTQYRVGGIAARVTCIESTGLETTAGSSIYVGGSYTNLAVSGIIADMRAGVESSINRSDITVNVSNPDAGIVQVSGVAADCTTYAAPYKRSVYNCSNEGSISVSATNRHVLIGGVISTDATTFTPGASLSEDKVYVKNLSNSGAITYSGSCDSLYVGGIFAMDRLPKNYRTEEFENSGNITVNNNAKVITAVGGYAGLLSNNNISTTVTSDVTEPSSLHKNTGSVTVNVTDTLYSTNGGYLLAGGLIGFSSFSILSADASTIRNEGAVTLNVNVDVPNNAAARTCVGGIAAYVYRTSKKTFSYLSNSGAVSINYPDKTTKFEGLAGCAGFCCGGIVGACEGQAHIFTYLTNSGQISADGTKNSLSKRTAYLGGILGKAFYNSASGSYNAYQIKNCINTGGIYSHIENSTSVVANRVCAGGILGYGKGGAFTMKNATSRDTSKVFAIYDCECSGAGTSAKDGYIYAYRGNTGGIVGYMDQYSHVLRCSVSKIISGGNGYNNVGGIAGYSNTYAAYDYCTVTSKIVIGQTGKNAIAGGIIGGGANSQYYSITHCTYDNAADGVSAYGGAYLLVPFVINSSTYTAIPCGSLTDCAVRGKVAAYSSTDGKIVTTVADTTNFLDLCRPSGSGASTTGTHLITD